MNSERMNAVLLEPVSGDLLATWRARLEVAKGEYAQAVGACYGAMEGGTEDSLAIRTAFFRETTALNEYLRVLRIFSGLSC